MKKITDLGEKECICGVYKITAPDGKIYIGQSKNINSRLRDYRKLKCKRQTQIYASLKLHGPEKHIFEVLEYCPPEELLKKEFYYQKKNNCTGEGGLNGRIVCPETKECYCSNELKNSLSKNSARYFLGKTHSIEARIKISNANKGRKKTEQECIQISERMKGVKKSKETVQKMIESQRGKKLTKDQCAAIKERMLGHKVSDETKMKISISNGKKVIYNGIVFNSISEGAKYVGSSIAAIGNILSHKVKKSRYGKREYYEKN